MKVGNACEYIREHAHGSAARDRGEAARARAHARAEFARQQTF
jgi:hypothetical protein